MISKTEEIKSGGKVIGRATVAYFEELSEAVELLGEKKLLEYINKYNKQRELARVRLDMKKKAKEPAKAAEYLRGKWETLTNDDERNAFLDALGIERKVIDDLS